MTDEPRPKVLGVTIDERIDQIVSSLEGDRVGFWEIISSAGRFDLSGDALTSYVRRTVRAILGKGAKPVVMTTAGWRAYIIVDYGATPEIEADAIINEWQARLGRSEPDADSFVLFFMPHTDDPSITYIPM